MSHSPTASTEPPHSPVHEKTCLRQLRVISRKLLTPFHTSLMGSFLDVSTVAWGDLVTRADALLKELFPICRSITGDGVRETLDVLNREAGFEMFQIPTGTECFDWTIPDEWNIRDAWIKDTSGKKIVDLSENNLHIVGYSEPVDAELTFDELDRHLHTLPEHPDAIPYRTTYYCRSWGFCLSHQQYERLDRCAKYSVRVDSTLAPGSLNYAERLIVGNSGREFLLSSYCCHPSLANDSLSGVVLLTLLVSVLSRVQTRHTYRCIVVPETIGAIAYLAKNTAAMLRVEGGLLVTTVAGPGAFGYKATFAGDSLIDRVVARTFADNELDYIRYPFDVYGSDERQYSSPYFRIPIGTICKDKYYEYKAYHTSLDNLDFVSAEALVESLKLYLQVIQYLEADVCYDSLMPHGEPMLGKRGLYPQTGGAIRPKAGRYHSVDDRHVSLDAIKWILFYADGRTTLFDIAEETGLKMGQLSLAAQKLEEEKLIVLRL